MKNIINILVKKNKFLISILFITLADIGTVIAGISLSEILNAASSKSVMRILYAILFVLIIWFITLIIETIKESIVAQSVKVLNQDFKEKVLNSLCKMQIGDFQKTETGKYVSWLTNDLTMLENNYFSVFFRIISHSVLMVISFITLILIHPIIAFTSIILLFFMIFPSQFFQKKTYRATTIRVYETRGIYPSYF